MPRRGNSPGEVIVDESTVLFKALAERCSVPGIRRPLASHNAAAEARSLAGLSRDGNDRTGDAAFSAGLSEREVREALVGGVLGVCTLDDASVIGCGESHTQSPFCSTHWPRGDPVNGDRDRCGVAGAGSAGCGTEAACRC